MVGRFIITVLLLVLVAVGTCWSSVITYSYDDLNRLTRVDYSGGDFVAYSYDELGNRITLTAQTRPRPTLLITPVDGLDSAGSPGGPFSDDRMEYMLRNTGSVSIDWTAHKTQEWVDLSATSGTLAPGGSTIVKASIGASAASLKCGDYSDTVTFTNETDHSGDATRPISLAVHTEPGTYIVQETMYDWIDPDAHAALSLGDDSVSDPQDIPFEFAVYGNTYSQVHIGSDGYLEFKNAGSLAFACPHLDDLDPSQAGSIRIGTEGIEPNRKLVISWVGVPIYGSPTAPLTFQVVLCETTNDIIFQYAQVQPDEPHGAGRNAVVGVGNGTVETVYSYNGSSVLKNEQALLFTTNDTAPPTVTISAPSIPATKSGPVTYTLNFSENVVGLRAAGIGLNQTGTASAALEEPTGSGSGPYTVTLSSIAGDGTLGITVLVDAVADKGCNLNAESSSSATVTVDNTAPTFGSITATPNPAQVGSVVTIAFSASEVLASDPAVTVNGHAALKISQSALDYSYSYTIQSLDLNGAATIMISGTDLVGNQGSVQNATSLVVDNPVFLLVEPSEAFNLQGTPGGPFSPSNLSYQLTNNSTESINWTASKTEDWVNLSAASGILAPGESTTVTASMSPYAAYLRCGTYFDIVVFTNETNHNGDTTRPVNLTVQADANRYFIQPVAYDWIDPNEHTMLSLDDDEVSDAQDIPFQFAIYGSSFSQIYVSSNGWLKLGVDGIPHAFICPYYDDLDPSQGGNIRIGTEGTEPHRKLVVSWIGVPRYDTPTTTLTFQVVLCETTNDIIFQYAEVQAAEPYGAGRDATVGIENATGTVAAMYSYNGSILLQNEQALLFTPNDMTPPTVSISAPSIPATKSGPVSYTLNFSEPVAGFRASGIGMNKTGSVDAIIEEPTGSGSGPYTVTLSNMSGSGTLGITVLPGAVTDMGCNTNDESSPSAAVTVDSTAPTFTNISANPNHGRAGIPVTITFTASETLVSEPTVAVNGHMASRLMQSGLDYTYNYTILPSDILGAATITISGTDPDGNQGIVQNTTALTIGETAWQTIKAEDFDGAWPNDWQLYWNNTTSGGVPITWAPETYLSFSGSEGGWPHASAYDPNIDYLTYADDGSSRISAMTYGPFSLSNATDARVTFLLYYDLGPNDRIEWCASTDGSNFSGYAYTEGTNDPYWWRITFDLRAAGSLGNLCGQPNVWFMLRCLAAWEDGQGNVEGPFIDDIVIESKVPDCVPPNVVQHPLGRVQCVGANATFCATASGTEPFGFQWRCNGIPIPGAVSSCFTIPSITQANSGGYDCVISNACGSATSNTAVLTVSPLPATPSGTQASPSAICPGSASVLTAAVGGGETVDWYAGSCDGNTMGSGSSLSVSPTATTTYYARARNTTTGCVSQDCANVVVTVKSLPVAPTSASVDHERFCNGAYNKIALSATGGSGDELRWSASCHGIVIGTGASCEVDAPATNTTYNAWWHNDCGDSECVSVVVTVEALPDAPSNAAADPVSLCGGGSVVLSATVNADETVDWYTDSCGGTLVGSGASLKINDLTSDITYFARSRKTVTGCISESCASVTVTVHSLPPVPANAVAEPSVICAGGSSTLSAEVGTNETIDWFAETCAGTLAGSGASLQVAPSTTTTYYARTRNTTTGCVSTECVSVTITVVPKPSTPTNVKASPALICGHGGSALTATIGIGETADWYSGSCGGSFVGSGSPLQIDEVASTTTYYARSRNTTTGFVSDQCASVTVGVAQCYDIPAAKFLADGAAVGIRGKVVSASFTDVFYIEEPNRTAGIRIKRSGHRLVVGTTIDIWGVMRTTGDGERYIDADGTDSGEPGLVLPVGLANKFLGGDRFYDPATGAGQQGVKAGVGLNNIGLLVATWGKFIKINDSTFSLDDGSGTPLKCVLPPGMVLPPESSGWTFVATTGISSCEKLGNDLHRLLRVRDRNDIQSY